MGTVPSKAAADQTTAPVPAGRSARKRAGVLRAATDAFLAGGYRATSVDAIAQAAHVSKQTVYQHFATKERLFAEVIGGTVNAVAEPVSADIDRIGSGADLAADLDEFAMRQLTGVLRPSVLSLRRLVIAEAGRFPDLGAAFFAQGARRTVTMLATRLAELTREGRLAVDDPMAAAEELNWLIMAAPVNEAMLLGRTSFPTAELERRARRAVATFLRAYRPGSARGAQDAPADDR